jgi:RNA polymerase sigma-B factor
MSTNQDVSPKTEVRHRFERLRETDDATLRERLILDHQWLAAQCARRYRDRGEPEADLVQVASVGLMKAIDRFDPSRDVPFHSFAIPTILGELRRHFRDATWAVRAPRQSKELFSRLGVATDTLHQRHQRPPTIAELAELLGVDADAVSQALAARCAYRTRAMPTTDAGWSRAARLRQTNCPDDDAADTRLEALAALGALDDRSRMIVIWRFYEERTQQEIGERLGIGQVQVSRLLTRAMAVLRASTINAPHATR